MQISSDALIDAAIRKAGLDNLGDGFSDDALRAWTEDLNHSRLNEAGRSALTNLMVGDLARRLQVVDCLYRNPEIAEVEIPPIIYISGLERTGTTFLHNLFNLHPDGRSLQRWELMRPVPPPEAERYRTDPRIARTQASIDKLRGTQLERMHWVDAIDPEECQWGMIDGSSPLGGAATLVMPTWSEWLASRDPRTGFHEYRQVLKLLLWKNPVSPGGHLVLKCPQFCGALPTFSEVFPEARFVLAHRDPYRAIVSLCNLLHGINERFMVDPSVLKSSPYLPDLPIERGLSRLPSLSDFARGNHLVTNVSYADLVNDPVNAVQTAYQTLEIAAAADTSARIDVFVQEQKSGKRAKPPRHLSDYGLDHATLLARPEIAAYCAQFGIEPEVTRQTGT